MSYPRVLKAAALVPVCLTAVLLGGGAATAAGPAPHTAPAVTSPSEHRPPAAHGPHTRRPTATYLPAIIRAVERHHATAALATFAVAAVAVPVGAVEAIASRK